MLQSLWMKDQTSHPKRNQPWEHSLEGLMVEAEFHIGPDGEEPYHWKRP